MCVCVKARTRVGGEGKLRRHQQLGSFHSRWTSEMSEYYRVSITPGLQLCSMLEGLCRDRMRGDLAKKTPHFCNLGRRSDD